MVFICNALVIIKKTYAKPFNERNNLLSEYTIFIKHFVINVHLRASMYINRIINDTFRSKKEKPVPAKYERTSFFPSSF